ncbi:hypothetical protein SAMN05192553_101526 [Cyclobacterium xiamenense]|jgi:hypothetical protein|uniref:Uncharacterized protein n=1 Tax=Cyclobacterium xiamenense TaxID=1297121 RepID=A0A1H6U9H8_9BACT|nr:DUF5908 family protein [Cyclobacterium xiamenense]SEI84885.1 hypothetical protein SAMN05192553_101526 [Cyclobacterium xiamenense]
MPIEIKELHIKIHVDEPGKKNSGKGAGKEELVALCVEQVMELLKLQKER